MALCVAGAPREEVLSAWYSHLTSHRVNWLAYGQVLPRIEVTVVEGVEGAEGKGGEVAVRLNSSGFEAVVERLVRPYDPRGEGMQGVQRLAFPLSIDRNSDLAGGWGTRNGGIFHGHKGDWPHCILPNATWLFAEGTRVDVFDAETTWDPPNPVLSERFVRLFRAVYGAVSVAACTRPFLAGLRLSQRSVLWRTDRAAPGRARMDERGERGLDQGRAVLCRPFHALRGEHGRLRTIALAGLRFPHSDGAVSQLVKLARLAKEIHPDIYLYQTRLPIWPYKPQLNATEVATLKDLVDAWLHSAAPLGASLPNLPPEEQPIAQIASLRARGKLVTVYDNEVPVVDMPWHRVRLFLWMIWLTDSGLWRPRNATAVHTKGRGLVGALSWYCDDCGAGFRDP